MSLQTPRRPRPAASVGTPQAQTTPARDGEVSDSPHRTGLEKDSVGAQSGRLDCNLGQPVGLGHDGCAPYHKDGESEQLGQPAPPGLVHFNFRVTSEPRTSHQLAGCDWRELQTLAYIEDT